MPVADGAQGESSAVPQPGREFGSSALLASLALAGSFAALGLNSISISRIEGASGAGLIALSTQFIFLATFVAGAGLRTSVTYRVGAGLWSPRSAVAGVLTASLWLGLVGAVLGLVTYALLRDGAMSEFSPGMAIALMSALPFALAWWIVPAIPLARERFEAYAWLTVSAPVAVLVLCPSLAAVAGRTGAVIGFAAGWIVGGVIVATWAIRYSKRPEAAEGPDHGVRRAGGFGARAWVNDLFQLVNLRPDLFILSAYYGTADTGVYAVTVSITSLVWIVSQPLASVVLPRTAMVTASAEPGLAPAIPASKQVAAVRHSVVVSLVAAVAVIPILALAPLVWGPGFRPDARPRAHPPAGRGAARRRPGDGRRLHRAAVRPMTRCSSDWSAFRSPSSPSCSSSPTTDQPGRRSCRAARTSSPRPWRLTCSCARPAIRPAPR